MAMNDPIYPDCKHANPFQMGLEFQDFVCETLAQEGIILQNLASKKRQLERGENLQGFEIKMDARCTDTRRLSIEIAEKSKADNMQWIPSGIYRADNTWLYVQGNYSILFVFAKNWLVRLYESGKFPFDEKPIGHPTIRTFYLPFDIARKWAAKVIDLRAETVTVPLLVEESTMT
jgi:hypothetical protein